MKFFTVLFFVCLVFAAGMTPPPPPPTPQTTPKSPISSTRPTPPGRLVPSVYAEPRGSHSLGC